MIDAVLDMVVEEDLATEFIAETQGREAAQFTTEVLGSNVIVAGSRTVAPTSNSSLPEFIRRIC